MQYYVIGPDGNKYGPADVPTLKQWVAENRLGQQSMLEDFSSGQRLQAGQVPGLFGDAPAAAPTMGAPGPAMGAPGPAMGAPTQAPYQQQYAQPGNYPRTGNADDGKVFVILGWILSVFGLVLCCPYISQFSAILGTVFAFIAASKGNPGAKALKVFSIIVLVISLTALILMFMYATDLQAWAQRMQEQQRQQAGR